MGIADSLYRPVLAQLRAISARMGIRALPKINHVIQSVLDLTLRLICSLNRTNHRMKLSDRLEHKRSFAKVCITGDYWFLSLTSLEQYRV